jgi:hypothetical protein
MRGYKVLALGLAAVVAFTFAACDEQPTEPEAQAQFKKTAETGNGLPPGAHYTLHIHGADETLPRSTPDDSKQNMWVKFTGKTKIMLSQGSYYVTDANGLDGTAAFRLPNPDVNNTGSTTYTVYAIGRGPGSADMTTCGYDGATLVCSAETLTIDNKGKDWTNAVRELLYLWDVTLADGTHYNRINLFHNALQGYFWDYDNNGLRLATLRFYECSTDVGATYGAGYDDSACFPD